MIGIIIMTVSALILGIILVVVETKLGGDLNLEKEYEKLLPNYNCGVCGFNTCKGMSTAMMEDPLNYKKCKPLRGDKLKEMEAYLRINNLIEEE
ncbi:MAG: (Fe-S)-binding protein [Bacilli bacterium]|nr:(Fe-S)-binding protein [Bacilli bacterium]MDD4283165.1 (Fe-S)-binding protein [Bacilli bacterium]MDD4718509.1 (Fe-S)-binding protein [Bacilli bacterium]